MATRRIPERRPRGRMRGLELPADNAARVSGGTGENDNEDIDLDGLDRDSASELSSDDDPDGARKKKIHALAMKRFQIASDELREQREREKVDQRFVQNIELKDQWPEAVLRQRGAIENEDGGVPYRPCITVNELQIPCLQVVNEARQSRFGVKIAPKGRRTNKQEAWLRQGLYRSIEKESNAHEARLWALQRAVEAGTGYWRVDRQWSNDGDFNQDVVVCEIPNQATVYPDPFAMRANISDMEYCFIIDDLPTEEYERQFGKSRLAGMSEDQLGDMGDHARSWVTESTRRVAEYFDVEHQTTKLFYIPSMGAVSEDDLPDDFPKDEQGRPRLPQDGKQRSVDTRTVHWYFINAVEILEERPWGGRYIPIIRTYGSRHNIDGKWVMKGMVSDAKDPARVNNYMTSAQVEMIGLGTKAPYMLDPRQIEGLEAWWEHANTHNYAYLPYHRFVDVEGLQGLTDFGVPIRNVAEPPVQAITLSLREAKANIKATTGRHSASLGEPSNEKSGRAIRERKVQGELSTSHFLNILANVAIPYEAMVVNDLLFEVYDEPGRNAILSGDTESDTQEVMLNQPFVQGPDGAPQPVDPNTPVPHGADVFDYRLTKEGEYLVTCTVGKSTQTQKEENALLFSEIITAAPQLIAQLGDLWVGSLEGPAAEEAAKRLKQGAAQIPPEMQQQMLQLQQANQQLQEMLQKLGMEKAGNQQKVQADIFVKRMEIASRESVAMNQLKAEFAIKRAMLQSEAELAALDREQERFEAEATRRHEKMMAVLEAELETMINEQKAQAAAEAAERAALHADRMDSKKGERDERTSRRKLVSSHVLADKKGQQALAARTAAVTASRTNGGM